MKRLVLIAALVVITGGWMAFDGAHALLTGDFVTPSSGENAGQLGPWARLLASAGLDPRSVGVKVFFLLFGVTYLGTLCLFLLRRPRPQLPLAVCAAITLLCLPFGTLSSLVVLAVLATLRQALS